MPQVKEGLQSRFYDRLGEIKQLPNQVVAMGAAYYATGEYRTHGRRLSSRSYGILHYDAAQDKHYIANVLFRDTPLPAEWMSEAFYVIEPMEYMNIAIYESTSSEQRLYDVDQHTLLCEEKWHFGRTITPDEPISFIIKLTMDGILELYGRLPNVPDVCIKLVLHGEPEPPHIQPRMIMVR